MAGFLYFIPNVTAADERRVGQMGLAGLDPAHYQQGPIDSGPGGTGGTMLRPSSDGRVAYIDAAQRWYPHRPDPDGEPVYWFGFETARPPGPGDLARERIIPGVEIVLGDGAGWICPTARHHVVDQAPASLPQAYGLDDEGRPMMTVLPDYLGLWELACETWQTLVADAARADDETDDETAPVQMTYEDALAIAVEALAANYRIAMAEARALGLFSTANTVEVVHALIDWDGLHALGEEVGIVPADDGDDAKKKTPDGPGS